METTEYGAVTIMGGTYRFVECMDTDTFATLAVRAKSLSEAIAEVGRLHDTGRACWKR